MRDKFKVNGTTFIEQPRVRFHKTTIFRARKNKITITISDMREISDSWYILATSPEDTAWNSLWDDLTWPSKEAAAEFATTAAIAEILK